MRILLFLLFALIQLCDVKRRNKRLLNQLDALASPVQKIIDEISAQHQIRGVTVVSLLPKRGVYKEFIKRILKATVVKRTIASSNQQRNFRKYRFQAFAVQSSNRILHVCLASLKLNHKSFILLTNSTVLMTNKLNVAKFLLINVGPWTDGNYKNTLKSIYDKDGFDFTVVTVAASSKTNKNNKNWKIKVHYYNNHYLNRYTIQPYEPGKIKWYPDKTKNLHGYRFRMLVRSMVHHERLTRRNSPYFSSLPSLAIAMSKMNSTLTKVFTNKGNNAKSKSSSMIFDISFPAVSLHPNINRVPFVKPIDTNIRCMVTPVFHEEAVIYDFAKFCLNVLSVVLITCIFYAWSWLAKLDRQTWEVLRISQMIAGGDNPARNPVLNREIVVFLTAIAVGFFFGSNLTTAMTSTIFIYEQDITVETVEDLKTNNLTVVLTNTPKNHLRNFPGREFYKEILRRNINYIQGKQGQKIIRLMFRDMLIYKNVSFTTGLYDEMGIKIPSEKIIVNQRLVATISGIREMHCVVAWSLRPYSIFVERLSDIYWRIHEARSTPRSMRKYNKNLSKEQFMIVDMQLAKLESSTSTRDGSVRQMELHNLWMMMGFGCLLSFVCLTVEIVGQILSRKNVVGQIIL